MMFQGILALIAIAVTSLLVAITPAPLHCTARGPLPDPKCTPGALNPAVTQANIHQTICVKGWTSTIRPPVSYTAPLKLKSIKAYGYADTNPIDYQADHAISLEIGGSPKNTINIWAEPIATAVQDDRVENQIHADICANRTTLRQGQEKELQLKISHGYKASLSAK